MIVDFSKVKRGTRIVLRNLGPDEPFGGGEIGEDFEPSDPGTTGQVMQFRVKVATSLDTSTSAGAGWTCPTDQAAAARRAWSATSASTSSMSMTRQGVDGRRTATSCSILRCSRSARRRRRWARGPRQGGAQPLQWMDDVTENPGRGRGRELEHPQLHHGRAPDPHPPGAVPGGEAGGDRPDDVAARHARGRARSSGPSHGRPATRTPSSSIPGELTRVKARFDTPGCSCGTATSSSTRTTR